VVIVPSRFAQVLEVPVRSDATSTGEPCARAVIAADTTSGRSVTGGVNAVPGVAGVATGVAARLANLPGTAPVCAAKARLSANAVNVLVRAARSNATRDNAALDDLE
jgi:hypothetical protein